MSMFDFLKSQKKKSTRFLIGARNITDRSLETYGQGELVFFIVKPHNLAVLSTDNIAYRLHAMTTILKSMPELEQSCMNSRESFEDNKEFLRQRIAVEDCDVVRQLCQTDIDFLDKIQLEMATAREFVLTVRFRREKTAEVMNQINRTEKLLKEQGFDIRRAEKADIQRICAVYFEQNITHMEFDDVDGERWAENVV